MKTKHYMIKPYWAKLKGIPATFVAIQAKSSVKAICVTGQGTLDARGSCMHCGRELTHPVSILVGVGPICGGHYWDESILGPFGFTLGHAKRLKDMMLSQKFQNVWLPRTAFKSITDTDEIVNIEVAKIETKTIQEKEVRPSKDGKRLEIRFEFDREIVQAIKENVKGRKWEPELPGKPWIAPITFENVAFLIGLGFTVVEAHHLNLKELIEEADKLFRKINPIKKAIKKIEWNDYPMFDSMYPFQKESVEFLDSRNGSAILADEMGLGKTVELISWCWIRKQFPLLLVVPASVKIKWGKEFDKWIPNHGLNIFTAFGKVPSADDQKQIMKADVLVINYDIVGNKITNTKDKFGKKKTVEHRGTGWVDWLVEREWKTVGTDESHRYKNSKIGRTVAIKRLGKKAKNVIPISATPIKSRPTEGWNAINLVDPGKWKWFPFHKHFCDAKYNGYGWDFNGASNVKELHEYLKTIMVRHLKKVVLPQLPPKQRSMIPVQLTNESVFRKASNNFIEYLKTVDPDKASKAKKAETLVKMNTLKQLSIKGKMKGVIEWVEEFLESGEKLIVFAIHNEPIDQLFNHFKDVAVKITGNESTKQKEIAKDKFQTDPECRLVLGNIQAAGEGIELTAASHCAFIELGLTPTENAQAEDRCYGRLNDLHGAMFYYLMADNSIEYWLCELLDTKQKNVDAIIDGVMTEPKDLLLELLNQYKGVA